MRVARGDSGAEAPPLAAHPLMTLTTGLGLSIRVSMFEYVRPGGVSIGSAPNLVGSGTPVRDSFLGPKWLIECIPISPAIRLCLRNPRKKESETGDWDLFVCVCWRKFSRS